MHPPDRQTRGRTRAGRLALLDAFLVHRHAAWLAEPGTPGRRAVAVDLGFGERPDTTLELQAVLSELGSPLHLVAVEREPHRIEQAQAAWGTSGVDFRQGGFALPLRSDEDVRLVRAMNVLRTYPEEEAASALAQLGSRLPEGALVLEGSCDPEGHVLTSHLLRAAGTGLARESLLLATDFALGFAPFQFRDWLPRDLRRRVRPGHPVHALLTDWTRSFEAVRAGGLKEPGEVFAASAALLARDTPGVEVIPAGAKTGHLCWTPPAGVPA